MKMLICEGLVTGDPQILPDAGNGAEMRFHVAVGTCEGRENLWLLCTAQGNRVRRMMHMEKGDIVTVAGRPMGVGREGGNSPILVTVTEAIIHVQHDA